MDEEPGASQQQLLRQIGMALQHAANRKYEDASIALTNARLVVERLQAYDQAVFGDQQPSE